MCGIYASVNHPAPSERIFHHLRHRGPDSRGEEHFDNVSLYHVRLAIQARSHGHQPFKLDDRYSLIYNGELYNHLAVREQLQLACTTASDTETLIHAFAKRGVSCLSDFDGMFAFVLLDKQQRCLTVARDRSGKKPVYIYSKDQSLVVASELNVLAANVPLTLCEDRIRSSIRLGYNAADTTPYAEVTELAPGHFCEIDLADLSCRTNPWWRYDSSPIAEPIRFAEAKQRVTDGIQRAVRSRVETAEVPLGSFLSGGIDSGIVTAMAAQIQPGLRTFTVSFPGSYDESPLARLVADRYQTQHTEIAIDFDRLPQDVETIVALPGEPLADSSLIPSYYVAREARKHITVVLNGDGADELFGGYRRYVPFAYLNYWNQRSLPVRALSMLSKALPHGGNKRSFAHQFNRLSYVSSQSNTETYLKATSDSFENSRFTELLPVHPAVIEHIERIASSSDCAVQRLLDLDFNTLLPGDLLVKIDIATMAHSLEGRSPLLCKELLELVPRLPKQFKIKGRTTKFLLRDIAKDLLPAPLIHQPKRGFEIPLVSWTDSLLRDNIFDVLTPRAFVATLVPYDWIEHLLLQADKYDAEKRAKMLWTLYCTEIWHRRFSELQAGLAAAPAKLASRPVAS